MTDFPLFCTIENILAENIHWSLQFSSGLQFLAARGGGSLVWFVCLILYDYFFLRCRLFVVNFWDEIIHINQYLRTCKWYEINVSMPNMKFVYCNSCKYCVFNKNVAITIYSFECNVEAANYYYKCWDFYGFVSVEKQRSCTMTPNTFTSSINCPMYN